jgi:hypothetical protein
MGTLPTLEGNRFSQFDDCSEICRNRCTNTANGAFVSRTLLECDRYHLLSMVAEFFATRRMYLRIAVRYCKDTVLPQSIEHLPTKFLYRRAGCSSLIRLRSLPMDQLELSRNSHCTDELSSANDVKDHPENKTLCSGHIYP